jgi:hypothetical protein
VEVSPDRVPYEYHSDADWETTWIEEHGKHNVVPGTYDWLVCATCGVVLHVTTHPAFEVLKALRS